MAPLCALNTGSKRCRRRAAPRRTSATRATTRPRASAARRNHLRCARRRRPPADYALEDDGIAPAPAPASPRHHGLTHALSTAGHELVHGAESAVHFVDHAAHDAAHALEQGARTHDVARQTGFEEDHERVLGRRGVRDEIPPKAAAEARARALKEDQVPFPPPEKNPGRVWNPMARPGWDILILGLIFVVMVLAPFEITFLPEATGFTGGRRPRLERPQTTLFVVNLFVDFCFLTDILLA